MSHPMHELSNTFIRATRSTFLCASPQPIILVKLSREPIGPRLRGSASQERLVALLIAVQRNPNRTMEEGWLRRLPPFRSLGKLVYRMGEVLPSVTFWTGRGYRCHPFFPRV